MSAALFLVFSDRYLNRALDTTCLAAEYCLRIQLEASNAQADQA